MSCTLVLSIPIPDAVQMQGRYCAQVLREALNYIEQQVPLTEGKTIDPQRPDVVSCTWECSDEVIPV